VVPSALGEIKKGEKKEKERKEESEVHSRRNAESIAEELLGEGTARVRGCGIIQYSRHKWRAPRNEHMRFCRRVNLQEPACEAEEKERERERERERETSTASSLIIQTPFVLTSTQLADANTRALPAPLCCASINDKGTFHFPIPTIDCLDRLFLSLRYGPDVRLLTVDE